MFLRQFETTATTILRVSPEDEEGARAIVYQYADKNFSLTDATSFTLMENHRIGAALTSDHNFRQYGFQMLGL